MIIAIAATLALGAGIAIAQVLGSLSVTPISDRYVIASGEENEGSWELTLYKAVIHAPNNEKWTGWCLDLDAPSVNDPSESTTTSANVCTLDEQLSLAEAIRATAVYPGFGEGKTLIFGQVSDEVARVEVSIGRRRGSASFARSGTGGNSYRHQLLRSTRVGRG